MLTPAKPAKTMIGVGLERLIRCLELYIDQFFLWCEIVHGMVQLKTNLLRFSLASEKICDCRQDGSRFYP